jgi:hypothetical protein
VAGVQPDIDQTIAAAVTLDVAGYVAVRDSFRRASWRVVAGHVARIPSRTRSMHALVKAMTNPCANCQSLGDRNYGHPLPVAGRQLLNSRAAVERVSTMAGTARAPSEAISAELR